MQHIFRVRIEKSMCLLLHICRGKTSYINRVLDVFIPLLPIDHFSFYHQLVNVYLIAPEVKKCFALTRKSFKFRISNKIGDIHL